MSKSWTRSKEKNWEPLVDFSLVNEILFIHISKFGVAFGRHFMHSSTINYGRQEKAA